MADENWGDGDSVSYTPVSNGTSDAPGRTFGGRGRGFKPADSRGGGGGGFNRGNYLRAMLSVHQTSGV